eukprot:4121-Prorocentrum_minimum.AAC.2
MRLTEVSTVNSTVSGYEPYNTAPRRDAERFLTPEAHNKNIPSFRLFVRRRCRGCDEGTKRRTRIRERPRVTES